MNAFLKLTWVETKLSLRNTISTFFTFAFPLIMLLIFGAMYGNDPVKAFGGHGAMDVMVPGYIAALVIATSAFMSLPITLASYRERGILRRYRATPVQPGVVLGANMLVTLGLTLLGTLVLILTGALAFHLFLPSAVLSVLLGFLLICLSLFSAGFLIACLVRNTNTARAVGMAVFYPMMFLSGGTLPRELFPETLKHISDFIPLTYAVTLMKELWFNGTWNLTAVAVLIGIMVIGTVVSVRLFRWE